MDVSNYSIENLVEKNQVKLAQKQKVYLKIKRVIEFLFALVSTIVFLPFFFVIAVFIKCDSPQEKVIFKQERIGEKGKPFVFYKFRSMKTAAPQMSTSEFVDADQYITKVGRILRKTSLDELPQIWSVLNGTMSLIGPRPLIRNEVEMHFLRNYYGIYQVKPGITGLAQINGRDAVGNYDKIRWDREYVRNVSFLLDLKILWNTVVKVLKRDGVIDNSIEKQEITVGCTMELTKEAYKEAMEYYHQYMENI